MGVGGRGELRMRGLQLDSGYLDNEKASAELFDSEGFLLSGDEVEIRDGGDVYVMDRSSSTSKAGFLMHSTFGGPVY